jgi:membrane protein
MARPIRWLIDKFRQFNNSVWNTSISQASRSRGIVIKYIRTFLLAARGFRQDKVQLRAASLTLYTLLSIIPMAAIAFAVAKGFGLEGDLQSKLTSEFASQQEVLGWILSVADNALQTTKGGYMAGIGVVILLWSVMQLLDHFESSFNHIWQVRQQRPWIRKFTDYIAIMLIAPVFVILSSSITVFISTKLTAYMDSAPILETFKPLITLLLKLTPYMIVWLVLTFLYIVLPNTKVRFGSAFLAGFFAGTLLQFVQWLYIDLQIGITRLSAIYGSFAAFPLFMIWIQTSWLIVLLGAELSFANQNVLRYEFESDSMNISSYQKKILTILILSAFVKRFHAGKEPVGAEIIAATMRIPVRISSEIIHDLTEAGLLVQLVGDKNKQRTYHPGMDINKMTVGFVFDRLDKRGSELPTVVRDSHYEKVAGLIETCTKMVSDSGAEMLIRDI